MISFEFLQEKISSLPMLILLSFAIGFVTYAIFPFIFAKIRVAPIKKDTYNQICFIVGFAIMVFCGLGMVIPYVFWTWLATSIGSNIMEKKGILVDLSNSEAEREAFRKADLAAAKIRARMSDIRARERAEAEQARAEARAERLAERKEREAKRAEKRAKEEKLAKERKKAALAEKKKNKARLAEIKEREAKEAKIAKKKASEKKAKDAKLVDKKAKEAKLAERRAKEAKLAEKQSKKSAEQVGFCRKCGTILHDNGRYCQKCGEKIRR